MRDRLPWPRAPHGPGALCRAGVHHRHGRPGEADAVQLHEVAIGRLEHLEHGGLVRRIEVPVGQTGGGGSRGMHHRRQVSDTDGAWPRTSLQRRRVTLPIGRRTETIEPALATFEHVEQSIPTTLAHATRSSAAVAASPRDLSLVGPSSGTGTSSYNRWRSGGAILSGSYSHL